MRYSTMSAAAEADRHASLSVAGGNRIGGKQGRFASTIRSIAAVGRDIKIIPQLPRMLPYQV